MKCLSTLLLAALALLPAVVTAQPLTPREGDAELAQARFKDGQSLAQVRIHYRTLGEPHRDAHGNIDNAVMLLHGTGGSGAQFLQPRFADVLFGPGQPLDVSRYYIILPDNIGHGGSSKPSDGLRMQFPHYDYDDMVTLQHRLLTEVLDVKQLRLMLGTSMGCMHIFQWATAYPDFSRALMPLACQPTQIGDRNRIWRKASMEAITSDPAWENGNYTRQPLAGLRTASSLAVLVGIAPLNLHATHASRDAADAWWSERFTADIATRDANDWLYQLDSSRNYDPSAVLGRIRAPMTWVNSADDFINPPELGIAATLLPAMPQVRYVLLPATAQTRGHGTHTSASFWRQELIDLLARSQ